MMQLAVQTISSVWPRLGELDRLLTPSKGSEFAMENVMPDRVKVAAGNSHLVILKAAFEVVLDYLHSHNHDAGNPSLIASNNNPSYPGRFA